MLSAKKVQRVKARGRYYDTGNGGVRGFLPAGERLTAPSPGCCGTNSNGKKRWLGLGSFLDVQPGAKPTRAVHAVSEQKARGRRRSAGDAPKRACHPEGHHRSRRSRSRRPPSSFTDYTSTNGATASTPPRSSPRCGSMPSRISAT